MKKSLPVLPNKNACGDSADACGSCSTGCGSKGRASMFVLLLVVAGLSLPMFLLLEHNKGAAEQSEVQPLPPADQMPVVLGAPTPSSPPQALGAGLAPGRDWRFICGAWAMPHEPRGSCSNCHVTQRCDAAGPRPESLTTLPTITRTSLLPHQYAGVCGQCHVVLETPVTAVNQSNADSLPLSFNERQLVAAGQQVVVPSAVQRMQATFVIRNSVLPHVFVGVCSNCHRTVDLGGRQDLAAMQGSLSNAQSRLLDNGLTDQQIAFGQTEAENQWRIFFLWAFGFISLGFFCISMVYVVMKLIVMSKPKAERAALRKRFNMKMWFKVHIWSSVAFTAAVILHALCSERGNFLLHMSLLSVITLTVSGVLLRYKVPRIKVSKKSMRWLHAQRFLTSVLIITAVLGHLLRGVL